MSVASSTRPVTSTFIATQDLAGITRGRAVAPGRDPAEGTGWVPANMALTAFGDIVSDNLFGSTGDLRLTPVGAAAELPDTTAPMRVVLGEITELDGAAWECCPRSFARSALQRLRDQTGLTMVAAFEHEFFLDGLEPSAPFSLQRLRQAEPFGSQFVEALSNNGFQPENWLAEFGDDQFEVTVAPAEALVAADRAILVRDIARDLARRHGLRASFAPMRNATTSGSGAHIHFSLLDSAGRPVLFDPEAAAELSEIGRKFAHGILAHAQAVTAICAPTVASYIRLQPGHWSVGGVFLGDRNREALLRICPTTGTETASRAAQFNLEFRAADGTCNPWLAIGMLVHAGLSGIQNLDGRCPVWPADVDSKAVECEALPTSMAQALELLENDSAVADWLGDELLTTFLQVRRCELQAVAGLSTNDIIDQVRSVY